MFSSRSLAFAVLMLALALPAYGQYGFHFGRNKIQYEDFDWHILKTEHFDIYYYPEMQALAEHGAYFAEEAYEELKSKFNFALNHRVPIIFYSSNIHFKQTNITPGFIPDGVGGFFEFLKGRVVIPANGNIHRFRRVIRHEMVHVFTYAKVLRELRDHRVAPDRFLPLWFTEGLAEYWSGEPDYQHEMVLRDALYSNWLVPLENIYRIAGTYQMYKQGEALCRFISERYGEEKLLQLMENLYKTRDFNEVMELTLREEFLDIADAWDAWLKARYYPELEELELPTRLAQGISVQGFNSKPAYYAFRDGRRRVYFMGNRTGYTNVYQVELDSTLAPVGEPEVLIHGERTDRFEAFHLFESRISISRDGRLAFVTKSGEQDVIHVYDLEADELGPTYRFEGLIAVYSPTWSPDGTRLAFASIDRSGFADLYVYDTETGLTQRLTADSYDDRDPSWSPDGTRIAFASDRTALGHGDAYNLFTYDLTTGQIRYVTYGDHHDFSPRWSPDGNYLLFTSARRDSTGRFGGQNIWVADMRDAVDPPPVVASADLLPLDSPPTAEVVTRPLRQLTNLTTVAYDPVWAGPDAIVFTSFEGMRFTIRRLADVDSLMAFPKRREQVRLAGAGPHWSFERLGSEDGAERAPYRRKYNLDVAQGQVGQNPFWGTTGGAAVVFSDMLGNDYWYATLYNTAESRDDFLRSLNVAVSRVQLQRRANIAYGAYRFGGRRYDITDPDAPRTFPVFWETVYGGYGAVSYPISMFRRIELTTSLSWSDKEVPFRQIDRQALLLSNALSLVHDNALYGMNGPVDGWRTNLTVGYTTDVLYSNVSYVSAMADVRHYWRLGRHLTLASWVLGRINSGREARLWVLGGSWDLRGHRLFSIRGTKMWFTSHELRFPILTAPSAFIPMLAPFGIANLRGALFFDAAHAWNEGYDVRESQLLTGETRGAAGLGFRINLFGGFVLRYDLGYRFSDGFRQRSDLFRQFFFGWDF
ncbi:hypothetical protein AWN76_005160 [Rhodothermaceae bacterium RA]|nr:hypothetical protein AWN76_005160 [Rhodothermaceae bacterium RA]